MADFEIVVTRKGKSGTLTFKHADVSVNTRCWWDPSVVIEANEEGYPAYATRMATKLDSRTKEKRPGIWLGKQIKYAFGTKTSDGIFIHEGTGQDWSDGCIVAARAEVLKIWDTVHPKGRPNILVKVIDEAAAA